MSRFLRLRNARNLVAVSVTLVVVIMVVLSAYTAAASSRVTYSFQAYWAQPSSYVPGTTPPSAFLQINSTASSPSDYYIVITYNSTRGIIVASQGSVSVSSLAPFREYVNIPTSPNRVTVANAKVYQGLSDVGPLVFDSSVVL